MSYRIVKDSAGQWLDCRGDTAAASVENGHLGARYFHTPSGITYQFSGSAWVAEDDASGGLTGDLTGNVVGDLTGNVLGNVVGDVVGDVDGSVIRSAKAILAASQAGNAVAITASNATAGSTDAGAADGGALTITAGDAKQKTSGNANGGDITLQAGAKVGGAGNNGSVNMTGKTIVANTDTGTFTFSGTTLTGTTFSGALSGNVSGDVTGNVLGDLTGDVTGSVTTAAGGTLKVVSAAPTSLLELRSSVVSFTFSGDGTLSSTGAFPPDSTALMARVEVTTIIAGDAVAKFDVGLDSDANAFTPTQIATVDAGVKQRQYFATGLAATTSAASALDVTISAFEVDGATPADPTSGVVKVTLFYLAADFAP